MRRKDYEVVAVAIAVLEITDDLEECGKEFEREQEEEGSRTPVISIPGGGFRIG
jgi:hypothetical protein